MNPSAPQQSPSLLIYAVLLGLVSMGAIDASWWEAILIAVGCGTAVKLLPLLMSRKVITSRNADGTIRTEHATRGFAASLEVEAMEDQNIAIADLVISVRSGTASDIQVQELTKEVRWFLVQYVQWRQGRGKAAILKDPAHWLIAAGFDADAVDDIWNFIQEQEHTGNCSARAKELVRSLSHK